MDGLKQSYKQIQSFGLSTNQLSGDFVTRYKYPNSDRNIHFNYYGALSSHSNNPGLAITSQITGPTLDYTAGALSKYGIIYFAPSSHTAILKFNPVTEAFSTISGIASDAYLTAICIGDYIYFFAASVANGVQVFDTVSERIIRTVPYYTNSGGYFGACLADNGYVYLIPSSGTRVQVFDPLSMSMVDQFGTVTGGGGLGGCYHPNGKVYCAPRTGNVMLEIDTIRHTIRELTTPSTSGTNRYNGGAVGINGSVYFIPRDAPSILKFNPEDESFKLFGSYVGTNKFAMPHVRANGAIIAAQFGDLGSLAISPADDSSLVFDDQAGTGVFWWSGVITSNGTIYCPPIGAAAGNFFLKIRREFNESLDYNLLNNRIRKAST